MFIRFSLFFFSCLVSGVAISDASGPVAGFYGSAYDLPGYDGELLARRRSKKRSSGSSYIYRPKKRAYSQSVPVTTYSPPVSQKKPVAAAEKSMIIEIQSLLAQLGYPVGKADGIMGPKTRSQIKKFQRDTGMTVTGRVTSSLLGAVREVYRLKVSGS